MKYSFGERSIKNLTCIHPELVALCFAVLQRGAIDFGVVSGLRTEEEQAELVEQGRSKTLNSRHLTGHAVDCVPYIDGEYVWDWPYMTKLADLFKEEAKRLDIPLEWGGDWKGFPDGAHFQLPWSVK